jgi:hypothetical protein
MRNQACIVTTLRAADKVLRTFIDYHIGIGFSHVFLFFDDPNEVPKDAPYAASEVTFVRNDAILKGLWRKTYSYPRYKDDLDNEVMARQIVNVEVARDLALEMGYDWILHIDIDELFVLHGYDSVQEHFEEISRENPASVVYLNHEAVPETFFVEDYLKEVTLFKRNHQLLNESQLIYLNSRYNKHNLFNYYANGKSAGRVHKYLLPGGVHRFSSDSILHKHTQTGIFHFPCCGFEHFMCKYRIRNFNDKWFGRIDVAETLPVYMASRDMVNRDNIEEARQFYKNVFMPGGDDEVNDLLDKGIYFRKACCQ